MGAPLHAFISSRLACEHSRGKTCLQLDGAGHRSLTQVSHSLPSLMKSPWQQALQAVQPPVPPCPWVAVALHSKSKRVGHCASWFTAWLPQFTCTHAAWQMRVSGELEEKHDEHGAIAGSRKSVSSVPGSRAAAPAS
jgi:hypothetical protein